MKHATPATLGRLEPLLQKIRQLPTLREKKRAIFYLRSTPFLHFHEEPSSLYADLRLASDWQRLPVNTHADQRALLAKLHTALAG